MWNKTELQAELKRLGCEASLEDLNLPKDADEFVESWNGSRLMHWNEYKAEGQLTLFGDDMMLAEIWVSYIHDDSGDNDGELAVAVFEIDGGTLWAVLDGFVDPDTGESSGDPAALRELAKTRVGARSQQFDAVLGSG